MFCTNYFFILIQVYNIRMHPNSEDPRYSKLKVQRCPWTTSTKCDSEEWYSGWYKEWQTVFKYDSKMRDSLKCIY